MKTVDLDSIKSAWKNERSFGDNRLSEAELKGFLSWKSKDISQLFRKGLIFDIVLKSLTGLSLAGTMILLRTNQHLILVNAVILLGLILAIRYQWLMISRIPDAGAPDPVIRTTLEDKIKFYHQHYIKSLYVGALSNSLLVFAGMLYYFYFKYGEIRTFQWDDYLVFSTLIVLSFVIGALAQVKQTRFQVKQLESCLQEIDKDAMTALTLREQRNKKRRLTLVFLLALICGLLILAYFIFG